MWQAEFHTGWLWARQEACWELLRSSHLDISIAEHGDGFLWDQNLYKNDLYVPLLKRKLVQNYQPHFQIILQFSQLNLSFLFAKVLGLCPIFGISN